MEFCGSRDLCTITLDHLLFRTDIFTITLQTAALDGVKLWDLRKLRNFRTLSPYDPDTPTSSGKEISIFFKEIRKYRVST